LSGDPGLTELTEGGAAVLSAAAGAANVMMLLRELCRAEAFATGADWVFRVDLQDP